MTAASPAAAARKKDRAFVITVCLAATALFATALAPSVLGQDPNAQSLLLRLRPPVPFDGALADHPFGTDQLGRDMLARCIHGLRLTLVLGLAGSCLSLATGCGIGIIAGFVGGSTDALLMRAADIQIAVPFTLLALVTIAVLGTSLTVVVCVIGLYGWERYARIVRGEVLALKQRTFVLAARAMGPSPAYILRRHILPGLVPSLIVLWTFTFSEIVLLESALSFLGLGVQPPTATLGSMVGLGRDYLASAPWVAGIPALLVMLLSLFTLLLGDHLRDRSDRRISP